MTPDEMKSRTRQFALRIITLVKSLDPDEISRTVGKQLLRSGTSVGANYRAACRARSKAEFRSKLGIVEEEADESIYWIEILVDSGYVSKDRVASLLGEANEILSIVVSSINTSRSSSK